LRLLNIQMCTGKRDVMRNNGPLGTGKCCDAGGCDGWQSDADAKRCDEGRAREHTFGRPEQSPSERRQRRPTTKACHERCWTHLLALSRSLTHHTSFLLSLSLISVSSQPRMDRARSRSWRHRWSCRMRRRDACTAGSHRLSV
jgi:hypothetical protein